MKRLPYAICSICLLTLLGTACHRIRQQYTRQSENPPCHRCASIYAATSGVKDIDLTELIRNEDSYRGQIIRVHGNIHNDAGYKMLYPIGTNGQSQSLAAEFTDLSSFAACDDVEQILQEVAGINNWFDGSASVVVVGRLGDLNHFRRSQRGFEIMCVEQASTVDAKLR